jgi:hypothetical protein
MKTEIRCYSYKIFQFNFMSSVTCPSKNNIYVSVNFTSHGLFCIKIGTLSHGHAVVHITHSFQVVTMLSPHSASLTADVALNVKQSFICGNYFVSNTLHQFLGT